MSTKRRLPAVALALVAANIAAAFLVAFDPSLVGQFGFVASHPSLETALLSLFLHENVFHLLGNMVFLAAVGPAVELAAGSVRFGVVYLLGGLGGVLAHAMLASPGSPPLIGASGAVASCAAYYSLRYISLRVPLAPKLGASVAAIAGLWLALQVLGAYLHLGSQAGGTAFWAHLGGFAVGLAAGLAFRAPSLARVELGHEVLRRMNARSPAAAVAAARRHLAEHPGDAAVLRELASALGSLGEHEEEASVLIDLLGSAQGADQGKLVTSLARAGGIERLPSLRRTMLAERLKSVDPEACRLLLDSVVKGPAGDPQRPDALLALASIEMQGSSARAQELLGELVKNYPMHPAADLARARGWVL